MSGKSERDIITACIKGKKSAFKELYKSYYAYVSAVAIRYVSNREETEEVVNDIFLKVFEKLRDYYNPDYPFKPWLRKVAVHAAIDHIRKHKSTQMLVEIPENQLKLEEDVFDAINANELLDMVQELPPAYRAVFNLYAVEGYKHFEIAELLEISEGTSKSNLHKARLWLQKRIKERYGESELKGYGAG